MTALDQQRTALYTGSSALCWLKKVLFWVPSERYWPVMNWPAQHNTLFNQHKMLCIVLCDAGLLVALKIWLLKDINFCRNYVLGIQPEVLANTWITFSILHTNDCQHFFTDSQHSIFVLVEKKCGTKYLVQGAGQHPVGVLQHQNKIYWIKNLTNTIVRVLL